MLRRTEESKLTSWYFEIDRPLLWGLMALIFVGMWAMVSAGSVAAERIGQPWHFFIVKALPFYLVGTVTLFVASCLNKKWVLGLSGINVVVCLLLLGVTLIHPAAVKGSARWVNLGVASVMPSDLMKPGFIMMTAWFITQMQEKFGTNIFFNREAWRLKWLSWWPYLAVFAGAFVVILTHPDLGTATLYFAVLAAMMFMAGLPLVLIPLLIGCASV
ncbi:FtsW/RodA/SpoVE family cell cycle protein, partial [bacterium]|nr:FtsW/RodA/SpoVE family cell cycle protein [bacterium]